MRRYKQTSEIIELQNTYYININVLILACHQQLARLYQCIHRRCL